MLTLKRKFKTENRVIYQASASHASHNDEHLAPSHATQSFHLLLAIPEILNNNKNVSAERAPFINTYDLFMRCHPSSSSTVGFVEGASLSARAAPDPFYSGTRSFDTIFRSCRLDGEVASMGGISYLVFVDPFCDKIQMIVGECSHTALPTTGSDPVLLRQETMTGF